MVLVHKQQQVGTRSLDSLGDLETAASSYRQVRLLPAARRAPLLTGAGWTLVRAGLRLARIDPFTATQVSPARS